MVAVEQNIALTPAAPVTWEPRVAASPRVNTVDMLLVLRGLACLMVVAAHAWEGQPEMLPHLLWIGGYDATWLIRSSGNAGVWIFFTLSGYLMGKAFWSQRYETTWRGALNFYRNRFLRICPLYFFSLLLMVLLIPRALVGEGWKIFQLLTFTNRANNLDNALWSLSTEVQFYLLVPLLAWAVFPRLTSRRRVLLAAAIALILPIGYSMLITAREKGLAVFWLWWNDIYSPLTFNIAIFALGFLLNAWLTHHRKAHLPLSLPSWALALVMAGVYVVACYSMKLVVNVTGGMSLMSPVLFFWPLPTVALTLLAIFLCEQRDYRHKRERFTLDTCRRNPWRALEWMGLLSYGVYIFHFLVVKTVWTYLPAHVALWPRICWCFFIPCIGSIILASVTYLAIERPVENLKRFG